MRFSANLSVLKNLSKFAMTIRLHSQSRIFITNSLNIFVLLCVSFPICVLLCCGLGDSVKWICISDQLNQKQICESRSCCAISIFLWRIFGFNQSCAFQIFRYMFNGWLVQYYQCMNGCTIMYVEKDCTDGVLCHLSLILLLQHRTKFWRLDVDTW